MGFHWREYDDVVVLVTSGRTRVVAGGDESFAENSSGVAFFRSAGVEHDVFNGSAQQIVFVEPEFIG